MQKYFQSLVRPISPSSLSAISTFMQKPEPILHGGTTSFLPGMVMPCSWSLTGLKLMIALILWLPGVWCLHVLQWCGVICNHTNGFHNIRQNIQTSCSCCELCFFFLWHTIHLPGALNSIADYSCSTSPVPPSPEGLSSTIDSTTPGKDLNQHFLQYSFLLIPVSGTKETVILFAAHLRVCISLSSIP